MKELHFIDVREIAYANVRTGEGSKIERVRIVLKSGAVVTLEHPKAIKAVIKLLQKRSTLVESYGLSYCSRDNCWRIETEGEC
jgi:hypothetical protein